MRFLVLIIVSIIAFAGTAMAQKNSLRVELADDRVDITTGFDGTKVVLFGTSSEPDVDIVVSLKGPEHTMAVRRKGRVLGAWLNDKTIEFRRVPSYYDYASTLNDTEFENHSVLMKDNEIGVDNLAFYSEDDDGEKDEVIGLFHDAVIRSMQEKGFFPIKGGRLNILDHQFFKAVFELPAGVPTGLYKVEAFLVKGDEVIAKESKTLQVGQVGFNARVYLFARDHSFFYGIFAVVLALVSGWSAFTFLRRD